MNPLLLKTILSGVVALFSCVSNSKPNNNYTNCNFVNYNNYTGRDPFHPRNRINRRIVKR